MVWIVFGRPRRCRNSKFSSGLFGCGKWEQVEAQAWWSSIVSGLGGCPVWGSRCLVIGNRFAR
jgi:hypothetical protein